MRCARSGPGHRTASGRVHGHVQPAWCPHRAQRRCTRGIALPTLYSVCGSTNAAQVSGFAGLLRSVSTRQLDLAPPGLLGVATRAAEPNGSGTEALSSEADAVCTAHQWCRL
jgi:hypothetical protein